MITRKMGTLVLNDFPVGPPPRWAWAASTPAQGIHVLLGPRVSISTILLAAIHDDTVCGELREAFNAS